MAIPPIPLKWWFNTEPVSESGMKVDSQHSVVTSLLALGDDINEGALMRIKNTHPMANDTIVLQATWLAAGTVCITDLLGNGCQPVQSTNGSISLKLGPNEITTLKWTHVK